MSLRKAVWKVIGEEKLRKRQHETLDKQIEQLESQIANLEPLIKKKAKRDGLRKVLADYEAQIEKKG